MRSASEGGALHFRLRGTEYNHDPCLFDGVAYQHIDATISILPQVFDDDDHIWVYMKRFTASRTLSITQNFSAGFTSTASCFPGFSSARAITFPAETEPAPCSCNIYPYDTFCPFHIFGTRSAVYNHNIFGLYIEDKNKTAMNLCAIIQNSH